MRMNIQKNTRRLGSIAVLAMSVLFIGNALADDNSDDSSLLGFLAKHTYVGSSVGSMSSNAAKTYNDGSVSNTKLDKNSLTGKIYAGIKMTKYFSLELAAQDLGKSTLKGDSNGTGTIYDAGAIKSTNKVYGQTTNVVGRYPVTDRLTLFGEAGVFFWHSNELLADPVSADKDNQQGASFNYGGGFEYDIGVKDFFVWRVEVQQFTFDENNYDATAGSTGLVYRY